MIPQTVRFVVLTGPIASGKSTIGRLAVAGTSLPFIPEDVDTDPADREILGRYYRAVEDFDSADVTHRERDPEALRSARSAVYNTQEHFIRRRAARLRASATEGTGGLVERHPSDDIEVFSRRNLAKGLLSSSQFASLEQLMIVELAGVPAPILSIFLHADTPHLRERIRRRGRPQEAELTRPENPYLEELNALYADWHERCLGERRMIRTDDLSEGEIATLVRDELQLRGIL